MKVLILFYEEGIYISPGFPHAVISINNSTVSGWAYVDSNWIDDNTVRIRMGWEHEIERLRRSHSLRVSGHLHRNQMDLSGVFILLETHYKFYSTSNKLYLSTLHK